MRPMKDVLSANSDKVLYVFYVFQTTQNKRYSNTAIAHVPKLVCVKLLCVRCKEVKVDIDCERCGKRWHSFWEDTVGDMVTYLCEPRRWANKIVAFAHNAIALHMNFILNRVTMMK